jgi:two-component system osmolarity sensor histidine kinase EnvZ
MAIDVQGTGQRLRLRWLAIWAGSATFFRTFLLLAGLVLACGVAIFATYRFLDDAPPEQRLAWEIASIVNITRSALLASDPGRRILMLSELGRQEDVTVIPLESSDRIDTTRLSPGLAALEARLRLLLTEGTMVAGRVNDEDGLWVSFDIAGDGYWLLLPADRAERQLAPSLGLIAIIASAVASIGALAVAWFIDRPLSQLSRAITAISRGQNPPRLREDGSPQVARANREFNRMARELADLEHDRSLALAGISHDLRSPLTRLRMEVELADLAQEQRSSMAEEIARIDAIVGQFVDYARTNQAPKVRDVAVSDALEALISAYRAKARSSQINIRSELESGTTWRGDPTDVQRIASNLIDNAARHGRSSNQDSADVDLLLERLVSGIAIEVRDRGAGIPEARLEEAVRPFSRLDPARTDTGGSEAGTGLGLAIVARICRRYGGDLILANRSDGGLSARATLPDWPPGSKG